MDYNPVNLIWLIHCQGNMSQLPLDFMKAIHGAVAERAELLVGTPAGRRSEQELQELRAVRVHYQFFWAAASSFPLPFAALNHGA